MSALDVSVQVQILNLLSDLQSEFRLTYRFVSHDLKVVQHICDRVAVMYVGRLVETDPTRTLFETPKHPYTAALLSASPKPHPRFRRTQLVQTGEAPDPLSAPPGCHFHPRCPYRQSLCEEEFPPLEPVPDPPRSVCSLPLLEGNRIGRGTSGDIKLTGGYLRESANLGLCPSPNPFVANRPNQSGTIL